MTILNQLKYSEPVLGHDPVVAAKAALLKNLDAQLNAATAMVEGKASELSERKKWYARRDHNGNLLLSVKVMNKPIEFQKGKPFIVVEDDRQLPVVIKQVIAAVQAGELNDKIEARVQERRKPKSK